MGNHNLVYCHSHAWKGYFIETKPVKSCSILNLQSNSDISNNPYFLFRSHSNFLYLLLSSYPLYSISPCLIIPFTPSCFPCDWQSCSSVPSCSCIMCWLKPPVALLLPPLFSDIFFCSGPCFPNLLYLNSVSSLIQHNLIIVFYCVFFCTHLHLSKPLSPWTSLWPYLRPLSNLCPTSVWLPSNSGLWQPFWNCRTYLHMVQVGTTHKLNPSPIVLPPSDHSILILTLNLFWPHSGLST